LRLLGSGADAHHVYLASPITSARTLADRLGEGALVPDEAMRILGQVAGALDTVAAHGLYHRELGPERILLTPGEPTHALLTDFGVALVQNAECQPPSVVENIDYRAPEEIRGRPASSMSNVYSLACVLFECLTGAPPYPYERPLLTLHAHLVEQPQPICARCTSLPADLDAVVARAMAKSPRKRYRSAGAFVRAAAQALGVEVTIPFSSVPARRTATKPAVVTVPTPTTADAPPRPHAESPPAQAPHQPAANTKETDAGTAARRRARTRAEARAAAERARAAKTAAKHKRAERRRTEDSAATTSRPPSDPASRVRLPAQVRGPANPHVPSTPARKRPIDSKAQRSRRGDRHDRRRRSSLLTSMWVAFALLASVAGGLALGGVGRSGQAADSPVMSTDTAEAASLRAAIDVDRTIERLGRRRATLRRVLLRARRPGQQASSARALAQEYARASDQLPRGAAEFATLAQPLRATELAFADMARAAARRNRGAWRRATHAAVQRERELDDLLRETTQRLAFAPPSSSRPSAAQSS